MAVEVPLDPAVEVAERHSGVAHSLGETGEQLLIDLVATGHQAVRVPSVRHAAAGACRTGQVVAVHDDDVGIRVGQDAGGEQAGHAAAEHHSPFSSLVKHYGSLLLLW